MGSPSLAILTGPRAFTVNSDIGIVFGTNTSLINTCKQLGIELIDAKQVDSIENKQDRHTLYHTVDWADIANLLKSTNLS